MELLTLATPAQYSVLYPLVAEVPSPETIEKLSNLASTLPANDLGSVPRIAFGRRRANAAVTLLKLGHNEGVLPVFNWTEDPEALTQFIFSCKPRGIKIERLLDVLDIVSTSAPGMYPKDARYALLLAIGEYDRNEIPSARRKALANRLADWYANDPSSGVHGAAGWLLRQLKEKAIVDRIDQTPVPYSPDREWFTVAITLPPNSKYKEESPFPWHKTKPAEDNSAIEGYIESLNSLLDAVSPETSYYTFIVFPAGEFNIGSVADERDRKDDEVRHTVRITRPFALLDREISYEELEQFSLIDHNAMNWYDAVAFCRFFFGKAMGLTESDQCYADPKSLGENRYPESNLPRDWPMDLSKRGFRLPTEAEWEVVARSGSRTAYGFGSDASLLDRFGWFTDYYSEMYRDRPVQPGKLLRPNLRGLFDLHGNLEEFTHDWAGDFEDLSHTDPTGASMGSSRVCRGGDYRASKERCRSATRSTYYSPTDRFHGHSFRLALTLPFNQVSADSPEIAKPE